MEKVRPWCGQPSDRGRLKNRTGTGTGLPRLSRKRDRKTGVVVVVVVVDNRLKYNVCSRGATCVTVNSGKTALLASFGAICWKVSWEIGKGLSVIGLRCSWVGLRMAVATSCRFGSLVVSASDAESAAVRAHPGQSETPADLRGTGHNARWLPRLHYCPQHICCTRNPAKTF